MTTITIFNRNPEHSVFSSDAFDSSIGKEVSLYNADGVELGKAKILNVTVFSNGIEVTYETDADLGINFSI